MTKKIITPAASKARKNPDSNSPLLSFLGYFHFAIFSVCVLLPFYVMLKTSFTSNAESLSTMNFVWFPKQGITAEAYGTAMFSDILQTYGISILRSFFNTLWQTLPTVLVGLFASGLSAFAFAKLNFPFKKVLFALMMATMMMPGAVLTMPSYIFYDTIGWSDSVLPIIIPGMFGSAMTVFFLSQFFQGIPTDLVEAAKIDGLGFMRMYTSIIIPLAKPAFIAQFIFAFIGGYNNYMAPLLYLNGKIPLYPLQMALTLFRDIYSSKAPVIAAFTIMALLPLLIIYIFAQKYFVEGVATTGVKG